ncbi:MAG: glycosyltransferase [Bacteroidales bacterium]|nr:glycosyltransferase [Bacteroidales bacterium]
MTIEKNPIDVIVSTGPPHSMHLIAMNLKKKLKIPWLADFCDPWTNIDFYKDLKLTRFADKFHHKLERSVFQNADKVVVISDGMADDFKNIFNRDYEVITNGFDPEDVNPNEKMSLDKKFSIAHIGSLVKTRNPIVLWKVLSSLIKSEAGFKDDLEIRLVGKVDVSVTHSIEHFELDKFVNKINYLQHDGVIKVQKRSQVLLLLINNTPYAKMILTGKFFEYLAAKRPIICIGPCDGDAAKILKQTNSGLISDFNDVNKLKNNILEYYYLFKSNKLISDSTGIENFSRKELTGKLAELLEIIYLNNS